MSANLKVTLAYPYTGADGVEHRADSTVALPAEVAKNLLHAGRARMPQAEAESSTPKTPRKKATKATPATTKKEG